MGLADVNQYNYQRIHDDKLRESICVAATVQVMSFDPAKMTVNVQPLSKHLENGKYESQPPILKVPVALQCRYFRPAVPSPCSSQPPAHPQRWRRSWRGCARSGAWPPYPRSRWRPYRDPGSMTITLDGKMVVTTGDKVYLN